MPCQSYSDRDLLAFSRKEIDDLTRMLCAICRDTERRGFGMPNDEITTWWTDHKRKDAERKARESASMERSAVREKALLKLTQVEREVLGF